MRLDDVRGFVFDIDGSLVHRGADFRARPLPGAVRVLEAIRASGRPLVLFTNGSHVGAGGVRRRAARGRPPGRRRRGAHAGVQRALVPRPPAPAAARRWCSARPRRASGWRAPACRSPTATDAEVVFVAHVDEVDLAEMERAARAVAAGAPLLTANYQPGYWGADGMIFSRGAMVTAGIAKVTGARPTVVGKPSKAARARDQRAARRAVRRPGGGRRRPRHGHRARPPRRRRGRSWSAPARAARSTSTGCRSGCRPDAVVDGVGEVLPWL